MLKTAMQLCSPTMQLPIAQLKFVFRFKNYLSFLP